MTNEESTITITKEQKAIVAQGIIEGTLKMMQRTISRKSPRESGRDYSKPYRQSKSAITSDNIYFEILTNSRRLPARPRDFRLNLAEEEKNIGESELSDILVSLVRKHILEPRRDKFPFPKGRPKADTEKSGISKERRGRLSYYDASLIKQFIDEVLRDRQYLSKIDNAIIKSDIFFRFRQYSFESALYQMKENQDAFEHSLKPAIKKYGIKHLKAEELDDSWIASKDLTDDTIKRIAEGRAIDTKLGKHEKNILYTTGGILFFHNIIQMQNN